MLKSLSKIWKAAPEVGDGQTAHRPAVTVVEVHGGLELLDPAAPHRHSVMALVVVDALAAVACAGAIDRVARQVERDAVRSDHHAVARAVDEIAVESSCPA